MKRRKSRSLKEDLNVTNLVDVTFAILVVFMITAPLMSRGVQVDLPKTSSPPIEDKKIIRVSDIPRTKNGKIVELAVKNIIEGNKIKNIQALANPETLNEYKNLKELKN